MMIVDHHSCGNGSSDKQRVGTTTTSIGTDTMESGTINNSLSSGDEEEEVEGQWACVSAAPTTSSDVRGGGGAAVGNSIVNNNVSSSSGSSFRNVLPVLVEKNSDVERNGDYDEDEQPHGEQLSSSSTTTTTAAAVAERETVLVNRSKIGVYLFLIVAAGVVAYTTHRFMENEEAVWYYDEFEEFTEEVFETTSRRVLIAERSLEGLSDLFASLATAARDAQEEATAAFRDIPSNNSTAAEGGQQQQLAVQEQFQRYHRVRPEQFYCYSVRCGVGSK